MQWGGVHAELIPMIEKIVQSGKPFFILTDNARYDHGVIRFADQPQVDAMKAGARYFEKANINGFDKVAQTIQEGVEQGLRGKALGDFVQSTYTYGPDEERPVTRMGTEEDFERFRQRVDREMQNLGPDYTSGGF